MGFATEARTYMYKKSSQNPVPRCEICDGPMVREGDQAIVFNRYAPVPGGGSWYLSCDACAERRLPGLDDGSYWAYLVEVEDYYRHRESWDQHLRQGKAWWNEHVDRSFDAALERAGGEMVARRIATEEP